MPLCARCRWYELVTSLKWRSAVYRHGTVDALSLNTLLLDLHLCGCSSVVERQLPKLNVVGSSPIIRFDPKTLEAVELL
jgi:hypothetical protein